MKILEKITDRLKKYALFRPVLENYGIRTITVIVGGAILNLLFAFCNGIVASQYSSIWYGSIAGYYLMVAVQRLFILFSYYIVKKKSKDAFALAKGKQAVYLANGAVIVPLAIALAVASVQMVLSDRPAKTGDIMAITCAAYTFYKIGMAIRHFIKVRRMKDPFLQTIRNIGIVDALVSVLVLETTLIPTFGQMDQDMRLIVAISAFVIVSFTIGIGSYMIIEGTKRRTKMNRNVEEEHE